MSIFEAIMLVCFGSAWPLSIYRSWKSKETGGKSVAFLFVIGFGYLAGLTHKLINNPDMVTYLYALNFLMVTTDIALYFRNRILYEKAVA